MKILLLGKNGQVGWELQRSLSILGELISIERNSKELCGDLENLSGITDTIEKVKPDIIVNAAAYTAVEKAETEPKKADFINHIAVEHLAKISYKMGIILIHFSTDYVFDGEGEYYRDEDDICAPLNAYGMSKYLGEKAIKKNNPRHVIFRTSWVYSTRKDNFVKKIIKLLNGDGEIKVINDQYGAPTSAELIADITAVVIKKVYKEKENFGLYNLVSSGCTTWYEFAKYIINSFNIEEKSKIVSKVESNFYKTLAIRPKNSRLSNERIKKTFQIFIPDWEYSANRVLEELKENK